MGAELSREEKLAKYIGWMDLSKDTYGEWRKALQEFTSTVPFESEVFRTIKPPKSTLGVLLQLLHKLNRDIDEGTVSSTDDLRLALGSCRRLLQCLSVYKSLAKPPKPVSSLRPIMDCLGSNDDGVVSDALDVLDLILSCQVVTNAKFDRAKLEAHAKVSFEQARGYEVLAAVLTTYSSSTMSQSVLTKAIHLIHQLMTDHFFSSSYTGVQQLVRILEPHADQLLKYTISEDIGLRYHACRLLKGLVLHSTPVQLQKLQKRATKTGALIRHIYLCINGFLLEKDNQHRKWFVETEDFRAEQQCRAHRELTALLLDGNDVAQPLLSNFLSKQIFGRTGTIPPDDLLAAFDLHKLTKVDKEQARDTVLGSILAAKRERFDWRALFENLETEFKSPDLIWTRSMKVELMDALQGELDKFHVERSLRPVSTWDYEGFVVEYPSLQGQLKVDKYYIRLLLLSLRQKNPAFKLDTAALPGFIEALYHRCVVEDNIRWKVACLRVMALVFEKYADAIKDVRFMEYLVWLLHPDHDQALTRGAVLRLLAVVLKHPPNCVRFVDARGHDALLDQIRRISVPPDIEFDEKYEEPLPETTSQEADSDQEEGLEEKTFNPLQKLVTQRAEQAALGHIDSIPDDLVANDLDPHDRRNPINCFPVLQSHPEVANECLEVLRLVAEGNPHVFKRVASERALKCLLQGCLFADPILADKILDLTNTLVDAALYQVPGLARLYAFPCVVRQLCVCASLPAASFLHKFHANQDVAFMPLRKSALEPYLPMPLIKCLELEGPVRFIELFEGEADRTDLLWNQAFKQQLAVAMESITAPLRAPYQAGNLQVMDPTDLKRVEYQGMNDQVCIGAIYLNKFNSKPGQPVKDPQFFMKELVRAMESFQLYSHDDLLQILTAQVATVKRFPQLAECTAFPAFLQLFQILSNDDKYSTTILVQTAVLMHSLLQVPASTNFDMCVEADGINQFCLLVKRVSSQAETGEKTQLAEQVLDCFHTFAAQPSVAKALEGDTTTLQHLRPLAQPSRVVQSPRLSTAVFKVCESLSQSFDLCQWMMESRLLLCTVHAATILDVNSDTEDTVLSAIRALRATVLAETPNPNVQVVIRTLVGDALFDRLDRPEEFMEVSRQDTYTPHLIWNAETRKDLQSFIELECKATEADGILKWRDVEEKFSPTLLKHEVYVSGLYLGMYAGSDEGSILTDKLSPQQLMIDITAKLHDTMEAMKKYDEIMAVSLSVSGSRPTSKQSMSNLAPFKWKAASPATYNTLTVCCTALNKLISNHNTLLRCLPQHISDVCWLLIHSQPALEDAALQLLLTVAPDPHMLQQECFIAHEMHHLINVPLRLSAGDLPSIQHATELLIKVVDTDNRLAGELFDQGLLLTMLHIMCTEQRYLETERYAAAACISALLGSPWKDKVSFALESILAEQFLTIAENARTFPKKFLEAFDDTASNPFFFWDDDCRAEVREFLAEELKPLVQHQQTNMARAAACEGFLPYAWDWTSISDRFQNVALQRQLCVASVFIASFNANPFVQVEVSSFFPALIDSMKHEFKFYKEVVKNKEHHRAEHAIRNLLALWEACTNVVSNMPKLTSRIRKDNLLPFVFSALEDGIDKQLQKRVVVFLALVVIDQASVELIVKDRLHSRLVVALQVFDKDPATLDLIFDLIHNIIRRSSVGVQRFKESGLMAFILAVLLDNTRETSLRTKAGAVVGAMVNDNKYGEGIAAYMQLIMTHAIGDILHAQPAQLVKYVDSESVSADDERKWNDTMRSNLLKIAKHVAPKIAQVTVASVSDIDLFPLDAIQHMWSTGEMPDLGSEEDSLEESRRRMSVSLSVSGPQRVVVD